MFLGLLLKDGDNQRISAIWMTHQQPELKKCTVDKAISFRGILDYTLKHFFHSKNKTRTLILTSRTDLKFVIAILNSLFFLHIWEGVLIQIHWSPVLPLNTCTYLFLKHLGVTNAWTSVTPFPGAVPSSSAALHPGKPLMHSRMDFQLFEELHPPCKLMCRFQWVGKDPRPALGLLKIASD